MKKHIKIFADFRFSIFILTLFTLIPAGCTVGPDYVRPKAPEAENYKENQDWKVAQPKDDVSRGAWWEIFKDEQLNELEKQVDVSNQNIAAAEAQYRQARALIQTARSAYFPLLTAGPTYTRTRKSQHVGVSSPDGLTNSDFLMGVDATWEPDIWGKVRRSVEAARGSAQAGAADLENTRLSMQATLAQDYFQLRSLDAQKKLYEETIATYAKFLQLTQNRYNGAVASRADVLQAQTQLKTAQAQMIDLDVQRAQMEHAIAVLIGKPPSVFSIPATPLASVPPVVPVGLPSELLERRPDIAGAERRVAAANAQIGVAKAAYYPNITLSMTGGVEASHSAQWFMWPSRFWSVGSSLAQTVFDGGLRKSQNDQARAAYDATVAVYRNTVLAGFQEVEDNLAAMRILEQEADAQDEAVKSAEQSLAVETNQYKAGTVSALDVLTVQTIALTNKRTAVTILGRRMTATATLIKALGGGWESSMLPTRD